MNGVFALLLASAAAQPVPAGRFSTLHTAHYRVHHPRSATAFAREVASRIESIRERVAAEVGWSPTRRVDVVIVDPYGASNGQALALSGSPRMRLFATPPAARSAIGHHRDWTEGLVVHEDTHIVHMTRPSRNPFRRFVQRLTGIGPVAARSPGWVVEGYATLVEGRLTGAGRPNDDARAAFLRMLARSGRFPSYDELSGSSRHRSGEFIYVVGSAFLEWLEREHGQGVLRDLWARMSARRLRSFDAAFAGLFGETPQSAYGRFLAEGMAEAWPSTLLDRSNQAVAVRGFLGAPDVSPDGSYVVVPVAPRDGPPRLVVYDTTIPEDVAEKRANAAEALLKADPDDVADVPPPFDPLEAARTRIHLARTARTARFVDDDTVVFDAWTPDVTGRRHPDLFVWDVQGSFERRVTRLEDVRSPDPAPDGTWAVALRQRWGRTQIVEVSLTDGSITEVTELSLEVQVDDPRVSLDGTALAWLENRGEGYGWVHHDRETGEQTWHPASLTGPQLRTLAFGPDGELFAEVAWEGQVAVRSLGDAAAPAGPVTLADRPPRTLPGGAQSPAIAPDGAAWVLTGTADGTGLHRLPEPETAPPNDVPGPIFARAGDDVGAPPLERGVAFRRPYGLGRWSWIPLAGFGVSTRGEGQVELALTGGDVMGRYSARAWISGAPGGNGVTGASVALATRNATSDWQLTGYLGEDQRFGIRRGGGAVEHRRGWRLGSATALSGSLGGFVERVDLGDGGRLRTAGDATLRFGFVEPRRAALGAGLEARGQLGRTGDEPWRAIEGTANARLGREFSVQGAYTLGRTTGQTVLDQFTQGGTPVSVWPGSPTALWVADPAFAALRQRGTHLDRLDISAGPWQVRVFATRTRVGGSLTGGGVTVLGIRGSTTVQSDPFSLLVADGRGTVGFGRTVEDPDDGFSWRGGQWLAWATWTWR